MSPTDVFLRLLDLPDDPDMYVDLRQVAVVMLCLLDRLASPLQPDNTAEKVRRLRLVVFAGVLVCEGCVDNSTYWQ